MYPLVYPLGIYKYLVVISVLSTKSRVLLVMDYSQYGMSDKDKERVKSNEDE